MCQLSIKHLSIKKILSRNKFTGNISSMNKEGFTRLCQKAPPFMTGMNGRASLAEVLQSRTKAGLSGFSEVSSSHRKPRDLSRGGFTLIELLITIAIIGILAGISLTAYIGTTKKAARSEAYSNLQSLRLLEEQFFADAGAYPDPQNIPCAADNPLNVKYIQEGGNPLDAAEELPGFKPGDGTSFSYCIEHNIDIDGNALVPCFRARAFGNASTRVEGDEFAIDCNNDRTF